MNLIKKKHASILLFIVGSIFFLFNNSYCGDLKNDQPSKIVQSNSKDQESIDSIENLRITKVVNAAFWGFDKDDATDAIQSAINSGATKIIIPNMGADWIVKPIKLKSNQEIVFEPGVVVRAKEGAYKGQNSSLFNIWGKNNVTLRGYNATLCMRKDEYMKPGYPEGESRMAIYIDGSSNVAILGLTIRDSGGDGIYIGAAVNSPAYCENITIKDCICDNNYRQGISITSAENVLIDNCIFRNTSGTLPSAGIDLEPSNESHRLVNIVINDCVSEYNDGAGFAVYLKHMSSKSKDLSILFKKCEVRECGKIGKSGLIVGAIGDNGPSGIVEFSECTISDLLEPGLYIFDKSPKSASVRFSDCKWKNVGQNKTTSYLGYKIDASPIHFLVRDPTLSDSIGGVEFIDCSVYDKKQRPLIKVLSRGKVARDINGLITIIGETEPRISFDTEEKAFDNDLIIEKRAF